MLTPDVLETLSKGDVLETIPLMPGISAEPILLRVVERKDDEVGVPMISTWMGITLGRWIARAEGGEVKWRTK